MRYKIVSDSSSNVFTVSGAEYTTVPMKVVAEQEYVDTPELDLQGMVSDLQQFKGKSGSSCPNVQEWLDAFADADAVFCVTISKNLSGSYNAARDAVAEFLEENPGKKAYVFDSLAAGPQQAMLCDKLAQLIAEGLEFEQIVEKALDYHNHTHILFRLQSLTNLARNGRINPAVAKIAGVLGIRVIGDVKGGQITPVHKPRGDKKAIPMLVEMMKERGFYDGAILRIAHCFGQEPAQLLRDAVLAEFPNTRFVLEPTTALCSFYAEEGGLMIGFEGGYNQENNNKDF
ncbi:MAG: DegV family protein [Oscillospiraceae bacterium]|nr:DegV family protein [Oscillospiraceae bacterium]